MTKSVSKLITESIINYSSSKSTSHERRDDDVSLDDHLRANSKRILQQRIDFVAAKTNFSNNLAVLQSKYKVLKANANQNTNCSSNKKNSEMTIARSVPGSSSHTKSDGIPQPAKVIYPGDKVELSWRKPSKAGSGIANLGNTCFLNSALQCFTYTPPLANYLLHNDHRKHCRINGGQFCMLCAMQIHLKNAFYNNAQSIRPMHILRNLKMIAKHLHFGRQEDAHEFIRYSIDAMQKASLFGYPSKIDMHMKATTPIHAIFGGYLRSRVCCLQCKAVSDTYDPFLDLSLDINRQGCVTLQKCLESFTRPEQLQDSNAYKCQHCKKTVTAVKKFTVHRTPNVLTIQLKRFVNYMGSKNNKNISYPSKLNMAPYISANSSCKEEKSLWYELYAVLVHSGMSTNSGHYYSYAKASNGQWYCFNDDSVHQVGVNQALNQQAYLLFYLRSPRLGKQIQGITKKPMNGVVDNKLYNGNVNVTPKLIKRPSQTLYEAPKPQPAKKIKLVEYSSDSDNESDISQKSNTSKPIYNSLAATLKELRKTNGQSKSKIKPVNGNNNNSSSSSDNKEPSSSSDREPILSVLNKEISSNSDSSSSSSRTSITRKLIKPDLKSLKSRESSFTNKMKRFRQFDDSVFKKRRHSVEYTQLKREKLEHRKRMSLSLDQDDKTNKDESARRSSSAATSMSSKASPEAEIICKIKSNGNKPLTNGHNEDAVKSVNNVRNDQESNSPKERIGILEHLLHKSSNVYGADVPSWNGGQSTFMNENSSQKHPFSKQWNDEFDKGKQKKVKNCFKKEKIKQNLFQRMQNFAKN